MSKVQVVAWEYLTGCKSGVCFDAAIFVLPVAFTQLTASVQLAVKLQSAMEAMAMHDKLRQLGLLNFVRGGFTLIELLVVVTVIGILAALLFPLFARAREKARTSGCQANLKQIGAALQMYRDDYDGILPMTLTGSISWHWQLYPYVRNSQIFTCPSRPQWYINPNAKHWWAGGYSWNREVSAFHDGAIEDPSGTIVVIDSWTANTYAIGIDYAEFDKRRGDEDLRRHNDGLNALYYDGHVKWRQTDSIVRGEFTPIAGD